mmetsp:Transcript_20753/g.64378  ORF Transcript_20753/g.64378 Transcript_20753/m.64378 type:complete len:218 (-) Transcript_20753:303-956(-)
MRRRPGSRACRLGPAGAGLLRRPGAGICHRPRSGRPRGAKHGGGTALARAQHHRPWRHLDFGAAALLGWRLWLGGEPALCPTAADRPQGELASHPWNGRHTISDADGALWPWHTRAGCDRHARPGFALRGHAGVRRRSRPRHAAGDSVCSTSAGVVAPEAGWKRHRWTQRDASVQCLPRRPRLGRQRRRRRRELCLSHSRSNRRERRALHAVLLPER